MPRRSANISRPSTSTNLRPLKRKASDGDNDPPVPPRQFKRGKSENLTIETRYLICCAHLIYARADRRDRDEHDNVIHPDDQVDGKKAYAPSSDMSQVVQSKLYFNDIDRTVCSQSKTLPHKFLPPVWNILEAYLFPWIFFNAHVPHVGVHHIKHVAYRIWEQLTRRGQIELFDDADFTNNVPLGRVRGWWWESDGLMPRGYQQWAQTWNRVTMPHDYHDVVIAALAGWWPTNLATMGLVVDHSTPAPIMRNMAGAMITSRQSDDTNPPEGSSPTNPQFRRTVSEVVHRRLGRPRRALRRVETEQQGAPLRRLEAAPIAPAAPRMQHMALPSHDSNVEVAHPKSATDYFGAGTYPQYNVPAYQYDPTPSMNNFQFNSEQFIAQPLLPNNEPLRVTEYPYQLGFQSQGWPIVNPGYSDLATNGSPAVSGPPVPRLQLPNVSSTVDEEYDLPEVTYNAPHFLPTVGDHNTTMVPEPQTQLPAQVEKNPSPTSTQESENPLAATVTLSTRGSESDEIVEQPVAIDNQQPVSPQLFPYEQLAETTEPQELPFSAEFYFEDFLNTDFELNVWDLGGDDQEGFRNQTLF